MARRVGRAEIAAIQQAPGVVVEAARWAAISAAIEPNACGARDRGAEAH